MTRSPLVPLEWAQTHTHIHTQNGSFAITHFHSYKVLSVRRMFIACSLFWSCSTRQQLWCFNKSLSTRLLSVSACMHVSVWVCATRREVIDSPVHIRTQFSEALQTASSFLSCILHYIPLNVHLSPPPSGSPFSLPWLRLGQILQYALHISNDANRIDFHQMVTLI